MKKIIALSLILLFTSACKIEIGTDVGNPAKDPNAGQSEPTPVCRAGRCMPTPYIYFQIRQTCEVIMNCRGSNSQNPEDPAMQSCINALYSAPNLKNYISVNVDTYRDLEQMYNKKKLNFSPENWNMCMDKTINLSCQSPEFNDAYNVNQPDDYSRIHNILYADPSCQNIFTERTP